METQRRVQVLVLAGAMMLAAGCSDDEPGPEPRRSGTPSASSAPVIAPPGPDPQKLDAQLLPAGVLPGGRVQPLSAPKASLEEVCAAAPVPSDAQRRGAQAQEIVAGSARIRQVVIAHAEGAGESALGELRAVLRSCTAYPSAGGVVRTRVLAVPDPGVATLALELSGATSEVLVLTHAGDVTHVLRIKGADAAASRALAQKVVAASAAKLRVGARPGGSAPESSAAPTPASSSPRPTSTSSPSS